MLLRLYCRKKLAALLFMVSLGQILLSFLGKMVGCICFGIVGCGMSGLHGWEWRHTRVDHFSCHSGI